MISQQTPQRSQLTLLGVVERLLTGAAVLGGAIYVLIYALYIEFYDDFGVRPEEVGWDRLAVLGRAAWVALVGIAVAAPIGWIYTAITTRHRLEYIEAERIREQVRETEQSALERYLSQRELESELRKLRIGRLLAAVGLILTVLLLVGYIALRNRVEHEADRVRFGETVNGIGIVVPFIDVRAHRAQVTWIGDREDPPVALAAPHLMYLGRGRDVAALVSCGRKTILIPADQVAVKLLYEDEDVSRQDQRQQLTKVCRARP
jgi:hypothetical protein